MCVPKQEYVPHRGAVELELEFDDGETCTFNVTTFQASIIMHFDEKGLAYSTSLHGAVLSTFHCGSLWAYLLCCLQLLQTRGAWQTWQRSFKRSQLWCKGVLRFG